MNNIIKVEIWNKETKHKSGLGRAVAGGIVAGGVGAVVGAATKKDKDYVTFKVTYESGDVDFIDAEVGSLVYKAWIGRMKSLEGGNNQMSKGEKRLLKVLFVAVGLLMLAIIIPFIFG